MSYSSSSKGCSSCGGSHYRQQTPSTPTYDRCAGGQAMTAATKEKSCGCQRGTSCSCGKGTMAMARTGAMAAPSKNYNKKDCPTFAMSCETKQALRDCAKVAFCDFLRCMTETLCPDGKFDLENLRERDELGKELVNCVGQLACSFMHCVPDALCPEPCEEAVPVDRLPCGYAVEVLR